MLRNILMLGVVIAMTMPAAAEWQMDEFMISFWGGPTDAPKSGGNDTSPEAIKAANMTVVMCGLDKLEVCRDWSFKAMLIGVSPEQAAELKDDEAVWGYRIKDEPQGADEYPTLAERVEAFREADPNHPGYINLGGSYQGLHSTFIDVVKPDILSYDYYQWSWGQDKQFSRLEEYRAAALDAGIPLVVWVSGNAAPVEARKAAGEGNYYSYYYPENMRRMRHSVFTSLAYGVKGIQWFHGCNVFDGGKLRLTGQDIAVINGELQKLGPVLVKLHSVDVFHTLPLPNNTRPIPDGFWAQVAEDHWVLGIFKDSEDNDFLLLANRDHEHENTATLTIRRRGVQVDRLDKQTGEWVGLPTNTRYNKTVVRLVAAAGDGELLRLR